MKTFLTSGILALVFLSFNAFSQTTTAPAGSGNSKADLNLIIDQTLGGRTFVNETSGRGVVKGLTPDRNLRGPINCDDFNVANSSTIAGWTEQSGDWQIFNNMLQTPGNSEWQYITFDGSSQADGCITARAIYGSPTDVKFVGLVARYSTSSNILFKIQDNSSMGEWDTYFIYAGGGSQSGSGSFGTDAIIQLEYSGVDVTVRIDVDRDGTWDYTDAMTVANTDAGLCGVGAYNNAFLDDFCCGTECGGIEPPLTVPLSNTALYIALALMLGFIAIKAYRMT